MNTLRTALGAVAAVAVPAPLLAHEGHGFTGTMDSLAHLLSSAYHIVILAAVAMVVIAVPLLLRRVTAWLENDVAR